MRSLLPMVTLLACGACERAMAHHAGASATVVLSSEPSAAATPQTTVVPVIAGPPRSPCPDGEVFIPPTDAAGFTMGRGYMGDREAQSDERVGRGHRAGSDEPHTVTLTRPFCIDAHEVTVRDWAACVAKRDCEPPPLCHALRTWPDKIDHPVNCVDWRAAKRYCESAGKSLPTEAQWEWAATHGDRRRYPWGDDEPSCEHADFTPGVLPKPAADAGCHGGGPSRVGAHPGGASRWPGGAIHDLAGNVWEWCLDNYHPYRKEHATDPLRASLESDNHVVRGGGWNRSGWGIRAAFRGGAPVDYQVPGLGLRCVRNLDRAP
jgi:formylglycine-generating enzyme required for sulfatase activity